VGRIGSGVRVVSVFNNNTRQVLSYDSRKRSYDQGGCVRRGVDLRLQRITSNPSQTLRRRLVRTTNDGRRRECSARRRSSRLYFSHFATRTVDNTVQLYAAKPDTCPKSRFCLPQLHSTPPLRGFPSEYRHPVWYGKTRMAWLPDGDTNFEDIFIRFDTTHERDRHRMTAYAAHMHSQAFPVFPCQTGWRYSDGNPHNGGVECRWGRRKTRFWTNIWLRCIQVYSVINHISREV